MQPCTYVKFNTINKTHIANVDLEAVCAEILKLKQSQFYLLQFTDLRILDLTI